MTNASNTAPLADAYAALKHEESALKARIETIKAEIVASGEKEITGDTCIVAVTLRKGQETLNKEATLALLKELGASSEQIAKITNIGKAAPVLNIKPKLALAV